MGDERSTTTEDGHAKEFDIEKIEIKIRKEGIPQRRPLEERLKR